MFNEKIPSNNLMHYIITLYHTTSTLMIQGSQRTVSVEKEFPILKAVLNNHRNHGTNNINDAYNHIPEIPQEHHPTEQQLTGEPAKISTSIDTSIIPENETKENTSTIQHQTKNTPSTSLRTLANPTIMITPPAPDIALTIPKIIVTPPDTAESTELCPSNSTDTQNPFTMKHKTDQMPSQNNSIITMIEMAERTPQKKSSERILLSGKKAKTNIPPRKLKNDTTPTVTIEMYNNLKFALSKIDDEMAHFAKRYHEEQKEITTEITDLMKNIIRI